MSHMLRSVVATAMALMTGLVTTVAVAPAAHAIINKCGGELKDYSGLAGLDIPFAGPIDGGNNGRSLKITPQVLNSDLVLVETFVGTTPDVRYAIGRIVIRTNSVGIGKITFPTFKGFVTTDPAICDSSTSSRVNKLTGSIAVEGVTGTLFFTISRA